MSVTAKLSSKFRISIPKAIREGLHWEAGQELAFISKGDGVLILPTPEFDELSGIAKALIQKIIEIEKIGFDGCVMRCLCS